MSSLLVAVADSVFPNLELARAVVSRAGAELRLSPQATPEAIVATSKDADALLVTYAKITADMIREMKKCRIISRFGIGVDNVDIEAATRAGIVVTKVPDYCIDEVSDHAMALLLSLIRKIPFSSARAHAGRWEMPAVVPIHRLRGTVLGLVGFGRIPQLVAPKAQAFGMRVVAYDPYIPAGVMEKAGVGRAEFLELVKTSDYISIHSPLLPETRHMFNAEVFRQMKPGALLVNTARGPIVDEAALARALDARQLAGAALDVLEQEPPVNSPLFGRDNVILTPHTSFYSVESLEELQTKAAEEVVRVLSGQAPRNPVNPEALATRAASKTIS
jgi:D-3-phosphoglycerate dehydrogenase